MDTRIPQTTPPPDVPAGAPAEGQFHASIRTRLLVVAGGLMVLAILVLVVASLISASSVIRTAQNTSTITLRRQLQDYLVEINRGVAVQNALILDRAVRDVDTVADAAADIYSGEVPVQPIPTTLTKGAEGQYYNSADDISSVFIPSTTISSTLKNASKSLALNRDVELSANLDLILKSVKENNPNAGAIYLGTNNDVTRYYPNIELGKVVPATFAVTQRPWYISALEGNIGREKPEPVWSPVYYDATGLGLVTTVATPVYDAANRLVGVVGLDITLSDIQASVNRSGITSNGYSFLIDQHGNVIILPPKGWQDLLGTEPPAEPADAQSVNLYQGTQNEELKIILEAMQRGEAGFHSLQINGDEHFVAYTPFKSSNDEYSLTGWSLATVVPASEVLGSVAALQTEMARTTRSVLFGRVLPIGIVVALAMLVLAWWGTSRLVDPILKLAGAAEKLGRGLWEEPVPLLRQIQARNNDEIGLLASTLATMAGQLRQTFGRLEQRVAERTNELERRSLQLQTAAEVSRDITLAQDLDSLLQNAVDLISQRFGYYTVGIFLVDETSEYAQLKAASGDLGQKLIQRDIRLRVGTQGIVGYVTRYGQARQSDDVLSDRVYMAEPLLTDTRSEMALPIRSGSKIIGALDVQSTRPQAFSEEDSIILQTLADQLAVAIENVRLVSRLQTTLAESSLLNQEQARQAWEQFTARQGYTAYEYDLLDVREMSGGLPERYPSETGRVIQVPVRLRDQVIGYIGLESEAPNYEWSDDDLAILEATANQAALSVENARLLAETRRRAAREQMAAEVTARMRASLDMENVLQTAMQELAQRMGIAQVEVHLSSTRKAQAGEGSESGVHEEERR